MREPTATAFYPAEKEALEKTVKELLAAPKKKTAAKIVGIIVPHAGYAYSGKTAGMVYAALQNQDFDSVIIIGPNHGAVGEDFAVSQDDWQTPLGDVKNDKELGRALMGNCGMMEVDELAHTYEHSIEVQLPFLQMIFGEKLKIVPLSISSRLSSLENCEIIGEAISRIIESEEKKGKKILVIASSDFTHLGASYGFLPDEAKKSPVNWIEKTDKEIINAACALDAKKFFGLATKTTVCGFGPIAILIYAIAKKAKKATLVDYSTSYDVSKEASAIVGYAGIIFESK